MTLSRVRSLWVASATDLETDPSANGSGYSAVPCSSLGDLTDGKAPIETEHFLGDNLPSPLLPGADGGTFEFGVDLEGLSTDASDGETPAANDYLDIILTHVFGSGSQTVINGEGIASTTNSSVTFDAAVTGVAAGVILPVYEAGVPAAGARTQWGLVTGGTTTTPNVAPNWTSNPTGAAIGYGSKQYRYQVADGNPLAFVYRDAALGTYRLMGWITSWRIEMQINRPVRATFGVQFDTRTEEASTKTSLPAQAAPANSAIIGLASPVWFAGTRYGSASCTIEGGYTATGVQDHGALNGRSGYSRISMMPTVRIEPLRTWAVEQLKRDATSGTLLVQLGRGVLASDKLNTMAFALAGAQASEIAWADANGRSRLGVTFRASRSSGGYCTLARA